ncbi:ribosome recycling factor [Candidatus Purcelliella pentastirinorum]|uniref:ribosome recycling factor n=1 Tax=Candidatus Purcelliella pentastirinorum TaxID=472834 RepID=UPI00237C038C|nr:ribosome recycling factor [Candidatus Purcelliella pentastirinorum]WDR80707.1 ribosome recycling factor [Candidatus Purcelliella pentastirinorum]
MSNDILNKADNDMKKSFYKFINSINKIRTGRVSTSLLENVSVEYYGNISLLKYISNITVDNNNTLKISVFDFSIVPIVCKAILKSNLGLNPNVVGNIIKIIFPSLTKERKIFLKKILNDEVEKTKIIIRNIRRIYNNKLKKLLKNKNIDIGNERNKKNDIQKLTNNYIKKIQDIYMKKKRNLKF